MRIGTPCLAPAQEGRLHGLEVAQPQRKSRLAKGRCFRIAEPIETLAICKMTAQEVLHNLTTQGEPSIQEDALFIEL